MTEKQKMLAGFPYHSRDPELLEQYHNARAILSQLNQLNSRDVTNKNTLLETLLGGIGENVWIETPFYSDYGSFIFVGHNTFINSNCIFIDNNSITIGNNSLIGPAVQIYTASHPLSASQRIHKDPIQANKTTYTTYSRPVKIGDNTWIGGNSLILPGVTIGNNSTIGAGSVVRSNIPAGVLAAGNPCKVIRPID